LSRRWIRSSQKDAVFCLSNCALYCILQKHELGANGYRGDKGNLFVSRATSKNPLYDALIEAGRQLGYPATEDFNGAQQEGVGRYDFTIVSGQRSR
jgi:choline dehydrogenase